MLTWEPADLGVSFLFGWLRSSAFKQTASAMFDVARGSTLLFGFSSCSPNVGQTAQPGAHSDRVQRLTLS